jgi:Caenorhabditis protein of unknown function, DUF268
MKKFLKGVLKKYKFYKSYKDFLGENRNNDRFVISWKDRWPCLDDNTKGTDFDRHYVYHTAWAAKIVRETVTKKHIDISSYLYFSTIVSAFIPVEFYDLRPVKIELPNLILDTADLCSLPFESNSIFSLSCMHVVEHIGLGRYGDPVDYDGDLKAMTELARVLAIDGNLLFVVPIGNTPVIQFNAHRIYTKEQIINYFKKLGLSLKEFVLIPENEEDGGLIAHPSQQLLEKQRYACGCFWFNKYSA